MSRPTVLQNIGIAMLLTLFAVMGEAVFGVFTAKYQAMKFAGALTLCAYLLLLLRQSRLHSGQIVMAVITLLIIGFGLFVLQRPSALVLAAVTLVWLWRSLLCASGLLSVAVDMALCALGTVAAYQAFALSGSFAAALWCFLLLQALHSVFPASFGRDMARPGQDRFNNAFQTAEDALQQLALPPPFGEGAEKKT